MAFWGARSHGSALWVASAGLVIIVVYAIIGALQILVWNPLAAVPGLSLADINTALERANESLALPLVLIWGAAGIALAAAVLVATFSRPVQVRTVLGLDLLLLVLGAPSHWIASFPAGMGLADTFAISGGDYTPWGKVLYAVSAMSLISLVALATQPRVGKNR